MEDFMSFSEMTTTKMGSFAEQIIIDEFARSKGYLAYKAPNCAHPVDAICISGSSMFFAEVKCKTRMTYKEATGIDYNDYLTYHNLPHPVYMIFVDPGMGQIYGNWLKHLSPGAQKDDRNGMIYLPMSAMTHIRFLTDFESAILKQYENSNYPTPPNGSTIS